MGYSLEPAAERRREMAAAGLLRVEEGYENKVPFVRSYLTPEGLRCADHVIQANASAEKAREAAGRH